MEQVKLYLVFYTLDDIPHFKQFETKEFMEVFTNSFKSTENDSIDLVLKVDKDGMVMM